MTKICIFGGSGSFGTAMTQLLLKTFPTYDYEIIIYSRNEKMQFEHRLKMNSDRVKYIVGDIRDWENNEGIKKMTDALNAIYPEKTIQEQLELYVLNCGISNENIEKIKKLLLE